MLEVINASKTFAKGTPNEHKALDHLNLSLKEGEFVTILGSNGAGKSTLFNAICGNFLLDEGSVILDGKNISYLPEHQRSAITKKDREMFCEALKRFDMGLEDRMATKIGLLSGGQRQVVTLLMSTIVTPKLLLLDEHTAALDPATAEKVMAITNDIVHERNLTTLMITHNMGQALTTGSRTIMLDSGAIIFDIKEEERKHMTVSDLLDMYSEKKKEEFDNDRILLN